MTFLWNKNVSKMCFQLVHLYIYSCLMFSVLICSSFVPTYCFSLSPNPPQKKNQNQKQTPNQHKKLKYFRLHFHRSENGSRKWSFLLCHVKKALRDLWSVGFSDSRLPGVRGKESKDISSLKKRGCSQCWRKTTLAPMDNRLLNHHPYSTICSWYAVQSIQRGRKKSYRS